MRTLQEMTLQEKLGQRLAAGFQGLEPPEEFLRLIKEYKVGNIILFRRNIQDGPQLKKLCATLRKVVEGRNRRDALHHHRPGGRRCHPACRRVRSTSPAPWR